MSGEAGLRTALEETGERLGALLRQALAVRLMRWMDGDSTGGDAAAAHGQGFGAWDGDDAGHVRSSGNQDVAGALGLAALPSPGESAGAEPARGRGEMR